MGKGGKMTKSDAGKLGQQTLRERLGDGYREYMRQLGKQGFQATILALAERQHIPSNLNYNPFRHLLRNLINNKGGK
jgi:hypothetical protein